MNNKNLTGFHTKKLLISEHNTKKKENNVSKDDISLNSSTFNNLKDFINKYDLFVYIIAFTIGISIENLTTSVVDDLIMPIFNPFLKHILETGITLGPFIFKFGKIFNNLINLLVITFVIFKLYIYLRLKNIIN